MNKERIAKSIKTLDAMRKSPTTLMNFEQHSEAYEAIIVLQEFFVQYFEQKEPSQPKQT
jgi:hypothetical protein